MVEMAQEPGTDLALQGGAMSGITLLETCSKGLRKLLTEGDDWRGSVRLIAINPTLREEAQRMLPALEEAMRPGDPAEIMAVLIKHAPEFHITARRPEEWKTLFGNYLDALANLNAAAVEEGFLRWNRGEMYPQEPGRHGFYPRPAEIYHMANTGKTELANAVFRARRVRDAVANLKPERTPEEKAADLAEGIAKGYLNPDGTINRAGLLAKPKTIGGDLRRRDPNVPRETPQQMAERMRRRADEEPI